MTRTILIFLVGCIAHANAATSVAEPEPSVAEPEPEAAGMILYRHQNLRADSKADALAVPLSDAEILSYQSLEKFELLRSHTVGQHFMNKVVGKVVDTKEGPKFVPADLELLQFTPNEDGGRDELTKLIEAAPELTDLYNEGVLSLYKLGNVAVMLGVITTGINPVMAGMAAAGIIISKLDKVQKAITELTDEVKALRNTFEKFKASFGDVIEAKNMEQTMRESLTQLGTQFDVARGNIKDVDSIRVREYLSTIAQQIEGRHTNKPYFQILFNQIKEDMPGMKAIDVYKKMLALRVHYQEILALQINGVVLQISKLSADENAADQVGHVVTSIQDIKKQVISFDPAQSPEYRSLFTMTIMADYFGKAAWLAADYASGAFYENRVGHGVGGKKIPWNEKWDWRSVLDRKYYETRVGPVKEIRTKLNNWKLFDGYLWDLFVHTCEEAAWQASLNLMNDRRKFGVTPGEVGGTIFPNLNRMKSGWQKFKWGAKKNEAGNRAFVEAGKRAVEKLAAPVEMGDGGLPLNQLTKEELEWFEASDNECVDKYEFGFSDGKYWSMATMIDGATWFKASEQRHSSGYGLGDAPYIVGLDTNKYKKQFTAAKLSLAVNPK